MTNKLTDAASIAPEGAIELEKEMSLEMLERSQIEELVERSMADKTAAETPAVEKCEEVEQWKPFGGATSVSDAQKYLDAIDLTNKVYQAYSLFGAVVQNIMNVETNEMPIEDKIAALNKAVGEFKAVLTPEKLKEFSEAAREMEENKSKIATPPDVVAQVVTVKSDTEEMDKVKQMIAGLQAKITELEARPASVPENPVVEEPVVEKSDVLELSKEFDWSLKSALQLAGNERKAALQGIINALGETFTKLDTEINKSEVTHKTGVSAEEITNVVSGIVDAKMATVTAQLSALTKLLENQQAVMKSMTNPIQQIPAGVPVQKSIQALPPMRVQTPTKGFSIRDIVKNTTVGG